MKRLSLIVAALVLALLAGGCSGIFPYKNDLDKNLTVRTKTDSGSFFTSVKARVDIYSVDDACKVTYRGTVDLKRPEVAIGLPAGSPNYLDFVFSSSSFLANAKGSTGFDLFFVTRPGHEYVAEASYVDGIYDVILKERKNGSNKLRELDFGECRPK